MGAFLARMSFDNLDVDYKGQNCSDGCTGRTSAQDHMAMEDRPWRAVKQLQTQTDRTASGFWATGLAATRSAKWAGITVQQLVNMAFGAGVFKAVPWEDVGMESLRCGGTVFQNSEKQCGE